MDAWDIIIFVVAAYIAITSLVRLMIRHRERLLARFRRRMDEEKAKKDHQAEEASQDRAA